jgi:type IV pilus assembly protein PilW
MIRPDRKSSPREDQLGFSLIELMVSVTLGLAITLALSTVYIASKQSFRYQETSGRLQEDAGFTLDLVAKDLRGAGFGGCMGVTSVTSVSPAITTYYPTLVSSNAGGVNGPNPLATLESSNTAVTVQPMMPGSIVRGFDSLPTAMYSGTLSVSANSSSLLFYSGGTNAVSVSSEMTSASSPITIAKDPYKWGNETNDIDFVVSSCSASNLFKGTVTASGSSYLITPSISLGSIYGTDAIVFPVEWRLYFVATRLGATTPSLYVISYNGNQRSDAQELVSNVESMRLNYGENTSTVTDPVTAEVTPSLVTDVWRDTAAGVTDWSKVTAVRIGLMMVTSEDNANAGVTLMTPKLLGQTYSPPTGASLTRARKAFSTTVVLRNQVAARE